MRDQWCIFIHSLGLCHCFSSCRAWVLALLHVIWRPQLARHLDPIHESFHKFQPPQISSTLEFELSKLIHLKVRYSHHVLCQYNFQQLISDAPNHWFPIIQLIGQRYNNEWQCPVWMIFWFRTKHQQIDFTQRSNGPWYFVGFPPGRIGSAGWVGCSGTNCWSCSNWFPGQVLQDRGMVGILILKSAS